MQAEADAEQRQLEDGDAKLIYAIGQPDCVDAGFRALNGAVTELTIPLDRWVPGGWLSVYADLVVPNP